AEAPLRRQGANTGQVAIELGREEPGSAHLAVADHVDAGLLLVPDREIDAVRQDLGEVRRPELAGRRGRDPMGEPARVGMGPDDAGQQRLVAHRSTSVKAKARAGLSTNSRRRIAPSRPRASMASLNSRSRYGSPGDPPKAA